MQTNKEVNRLFKALVPCYFTVPLEGFILLINKVVSESLNSIQELLGKFSAKKKKKKV